MKVIVDKNKCIGCGMCEGIEPNVFQIDDEGISKVICDDFTEIDMETIEEAIDDCPTNAISKEE